MKKRWSTFVLPILWLLSFSLSGQISFTAKANKYVVGENERFTVEFKLNERGSNFNPPDFTHFVVLSGPNPSQVSSFDSRRGRSFSLAYSYYLRPRKKGTFTIGSASIKAGGRTYKTEPLKIEVVEQAAQPANPNDPRALAEANAFFKVQTNKTTVYRGEPLVANYKIYFNTQVGNPQVMEEPDFTGFYKETVELKNIETRNERFGNRRYQAGVVRQIILIPQKTGALSPGEVKMRIPTIVETNRRDFFGFRSRQQVDQEQVERFPRITVKPLPETGRPSSFEGAVGDYSFDVSVSRTELSADESLSLKVSVKGSGNLKLANLPEPELPSAFEAFDPKYKESIRVNQGGMSGSKSNEYLLIPRYGGTYKIPAMEFSFFNPDTERYETLRSKSFEVTVEGGVPSPGTGSAVAAEKEGVSFLGKDILTIKKDLELSQRSAPFFGSRLFYTLLIGMLVLLALLTGLGIYLKNRKVDLTLEKQTKASKKARKHLAKAKKELDAQNIEVFYEALAHALWGYFGDKLNIAPSKLSKETIADKLSAKTIDEALINQATDMLNRAEIARYTGVTGLNSRKDYEDTALMITQMDRHL